MRFMTSRRTIGLVGSVHLPIYDMTLRAVPGNSFPERSTGSASRPVSGVRTLMALFGFNKQKVLASAEKYVQQGKLQNAITEYEKVLKNDAKDLTVTNTVGDLYSRLGETDKATVCFKTVGDAYASQGFTVKAIAMYKKICKLQPSLESLLKLAELYSQQGLFNDARAQYLQVAEEFLKSGQLDNAVRIFQKIVEMDPENSNMRVRLAEVYIRLGKKSDAWQIFSAAAESLRSKGSLSGVEEILQRMLTLDPGNAYALLMQGKNMLESGDAAGAVATLQKVPDIDSNPDGLKDLLKAYLQAGQLSEAGTVANKLLTVHNDLAAISSFADALMQAGQYETALQVFDQHAERLLAENSDKVLESLHTIIGHVRDNPDSLQKLLDLFNKAGENTHVSEVIELLAHASVQAGDLPRARDLYQKLATVEPQNPLHMQNYQQVVGQIGGTSGGKLITPEEAVVLIDDLEATAPSVHQHYTDEEQRTLLRALARSANTQGWWHDYSDVLPNWFEAYVGLEEAATSIRAYEIQFVPGLLQTEEYARAVTLLGHANAPADEIDRRVRLRMGRQTLLTRPHPSHMWAVLDEAVLRRPVGRPGVMRAQLKYLLEVADRPNVTIQTIPFQFGGHAAAGGPFSILRFAEPDLPDVVYLEQLTSALYLDKRETVEHYLAVMERLCLEAEPAYGTAKVINAILRER